MNRACLIDRLNALKIDVRAVLGNKLCLPKIYFGMFPNRGLSPKEARQGELLIDTAIHLVSKEIDKLIDEMEREDL